MGYYHMEKWRLTLSVKDLPENNMTYIGFLKSHDIKLNKREFEFEIDDRLLEVSLRVFDNHLEMFEKSNELSLFLSLSKNESRMLYRLQGYKLQSIYIELMELKIAQDKYKFHYRLKLDSETWQENKVCLERVE